MLRLCNQQGCVPSQKPPAGLKPAGGHGSRLLEGYGLTRVSAPVI